jgi:deazaflavin-dependent oxidoreductase (nitroreductase family)
MPNVRWLLALITSVHRFLYRISNGRIGARTGKVDVLLLETVGRKTGRLRSTPLLYVRDGANWVVVASNAGDDRHPAWWLNLQSRPEARIQVRDERHAIHARRATGDEGERLWPRLVTAYKSYDAYRDRTRREIPIVVLEPA